MVESDLNSVETEVVTAIQESGEILGVRELDEIRASIKSIVEGPRYFCLTEKGLQLLDQEQVGQGDGKLLDYLRIISNGFAKEDPIRETNALAAGLIEDISNRQRREQIDLLILNHIPMEAAA